MDWWYKVDTCPLVLSQLISSYSLQYTYCQRCKEIFLQRRTDQCCTIKPSSFSELIVACCSVTFLTELSCVGMLVAVDNVVRLLDETCTNRVAAFTSEIRLSE